MGNSHSCLLSKGAAQIKVTAPDLAAKLLIEHESGTTLTIASDGAVTLDTGGKDIILKSGDASITLSGGKVQLKGTAVEVAS